MTAIPQFGPLLHEHGVTFHLWAPAARSIDLVLDRPITMERRGDWFELYVEDAGSGTRYRFNIDGEIEIADPASHFQPQDVHGPSEVIDHRYDWQCKEWKGRPWHEAVFSELHVGTFTPEGTFRAIIDKLDHLAETGFTALELMPIADFSGRWNWGYDGVLPFAPDSTYGRPEDLKALVDAAHARGLMMFLDVVYNHVGPEGNYLHHIAPNFFSDGETPWGRAINYAMPQVRAFAIENAWHWLTRYRFDGLRLDAVDAIDAPGAAELLHDLSVTAGRLARETGRHIHLVLENDHNRAALLAPQEEPPAGRYRAQWNDDYHHAWHVLLTGENGGYYRDYDDTEKRVARTLADGFAYQGEPSPYRKGKPRGEPSGPLPRAAFINFLQNHDQIGNRPLSDRLSTLVKPAALEAALTVLLLQPSPPLLFMGEEWGATEPFPFFCDFTGELADAVREGRRRDLADAYAACGPDFPDPLALGTRVAAMLDWDARARAPNAKRLELTRALLAARHQHIVPLLPAITQGGQAQLLDGVLTASWPADTKCLRMIVNLSDTERLRPKFAEGKIFYRKSIWGDAFESPPPARLPPWSVHVALDESKPASA